MKKGFTLIELMVVIAVLAMLAGLIVFGVNKIMRATEATKRNASVQVVKAAIIAYRDAMGEYPISGDQEQYGTVSNGNANRPNGVIFLNLLGRSSNGKRDTSKKEYIDPLLYQVYQPGSGVRSLKDAIIDGKLSETMYVGFPIRFDISKITDDKTKDKHRDLNGRRMFAPIKVVFDLENDEYTVSIPGETNPDALIQL